MGCTVTGVSLPATSGAKSDHRYRHVQPGRIRWQRHYEKDRLKNQSELDVVDVVLTTYQTLVSEFRKKTERNFAISL